MNQLYWQNEDSCDIVRDALISENLVISSTDTVLGLLANTTKSGFLALNQIKKRSGKPYIILVSDVSKIEHFADIPDNDVVKQLIARMPGPFTLILPAKKGLGDHIACDNKVAVRVPNHPGLQRLLRSFDGLFSTSANMHNRPVPHTIEEIDSDITKEISYAITDDVSLDNTRQYMPSTIIDCTTHPVQIVRSGNMSLKNCLHSV